MATNKGRNKPPNEVKQTGSIHTSHLMFLVKYRVPKEVYPSQKLQDHAYELYNLCVSKGDSRSEKKCQNQPILNQRLRKYLEIYCTICCRNLLIKRRFEIVTPLAKLQKIRLGETTHLPIVKTLTAVGETRIYFLAPCSRGHPEL